jgi:hypothetical protein
MGSQIFSRRFRDFTLDCFDAFLLMRKSRGNFSTMGKLRRSVAWPGNSTALINRSPTIKSFTKAVSPRVERCAGFVTMRVLAKLIVRRK